MAPKVDRPTEVDFAAVVLKGIIEYRDASTYFGSTGALNAWRAVAQKKGWISEGDESTEAGRKHYAERGLGTLPKTPNQRAYFWGLVELHGNRTLTIPPLGLPTLGGPSRDSSAAEKAESERFGGLQITGRARASDKSSRLRHKF